MSLAPMQEPNTERPNDWSALRITIVYLIVGGLWILLSDNLVAVFVKDRRLLTEISIYKGWLYVLITAWMLYALIHRAIAAIHRAQQEEQDVRARLESLIINLPFDLWSTDEEGRYVLQNPASKRHWGEVIGKRPGELDIPSNIADQWERNNARAMGGEIVQGEYRYSHAGHLAVGFNVIAPVIEAGIVRGTVGVNVDVTDRVRAETALRRSEDIFRKRYEAIQAGVIVYDTQGKVVYTNKTACQILGQKCDDLAGIHISNPMIEMIDERGSPLSASEHPVAVSLKTGSPIRDVVMGISSESEGSTRWILVNSQPIFDRETGSLNEVVVTMVDITDRKLAEEALRNSEQRLSDIFDFLPDATFVIDRNGTVIAWNRECETLTGLKAEQMLGKDNYEYAIPFYGTKRPLLIDMVLHPEMGIDQQYLNMQKADRTLVAEAYTSKLKPGGAYIWGKASPLYDRNGNVVGAIETIRDVTDRKHAEESLRETNDRLRALIGASPLAIMVLDTQSRLLLMNPAAERIFGWSSAELLGKPLPAASEEEREANREILRRLLQGEQIVGLELHRHKKDGNPVELELSTALLYDAEGKVNAVMALMSDVTDKKRAEQEILDRKARELQIELDAEEAKRQFYRGTILSVTEGKLHLVDNDTVESLLAADREQYPLHTGADLPSMRWNIDDYCRNLGMSAERTHELTTAFGEAAANAIKHANGGEVTVGTKGDVVQISVRDYGPGMDTLILPKATLMRGFSTKPSMGLGFSVILGSVDSVYLSTGNTGTWVVIEKKISPPSEEINLGALPDTW